MQDGRSALHRAIANGDDKIVEMLVKAGADANAADEVR